MPSNKLYLAILNSLCWLFAAAHLTVKVATRQDIPIEVPLLFVGLTMLVAKQIADVRSITSSMERPDDR